MSNLANIVDPGQKIFGLTQSIDCGVFSRQVLEWLVDFQDENLVRIVPNKHRSWLLFYAVIIQDIHLANHKELGDVFADGKRWIFMRLEEWEEKFGRMFGKTAIADHLARLEATGLIKIEKKKQHTYSYGNQKNWFRVCYERFAELLFLLEDKRKSISGYSGNDYLDSSDQKLNSPPTPQRGIGEDGKDFEDQESSLQINFSDQEKTSEITGIETMDKINFSEVVTQNNTEISQRIPVVVPTVVETKSGKCIPRCKPAPWNNRSPLAHEQERATKDRREFELTQEIETENGLLSCRQALLEYFEMQCEKDPIRKVNAIAHEYIQYGTRHSLLRDWFAGNPLGTIQNQVAISQMKEWEVAPGKVHEGFSFYLFQKCQHFNNAGEAENDGLTETRMRFELERNHQAIAKHWKQFQLDLEYWTRNTEPLLKKGVDISSLCPPQWFVKYIAHKKPVNQELVTKGMTMLTNYAIASGVTPESIGAVSSQPELSQPFDVDKAIGAIASGMSMPIGDDAPEAETTPVGKLLRSQQNQRLAAIGFNNESNNDIVEPTGATNLAVYQPIRIDGQKQQPDDIAIAQLRLTGIVIRKPFSPEAKMEVVDLVDGLVEESKKIKLLEYALNTVTKPEWLAWFKDPVALEFLGFELVNGRVEPYLDF